MSETKSLISAESLELLKKCKDKIIIGLSSTDKDEVSNETGTVIWPLLINFSDGSIGKVGIDYMNMKLLGRDETISKLVFENVNKSDLRSEIFTHKIPNLEISKIHITTENIVSRDPELGDDDIVLESGISFEDAKGMAFSVALGKDYEDDDWMGYGLNKTVDDLRPIDEIANAWGNGMDGHTVSVRRSIRLL